MNNTLKIRDLTCRDGQQSLFATRMKQESIEQLLPYYKKAGFYAMEVWGGAVPDSVMRYLGENPWYRLRSISDAIGGVSKLTALSRGRNLFGYVPYPNSVLEGFYKEAISNGLGIMRIFDALNDLDNVKESFRLINQMGGIADGAVCYTVDPKSEEIPEKGGFFSRLFGKKQSAPKQIFSDDYFIEKAKGFEQFGAKIITLKDMAGLVTPSRISTLMPKLKVAVNVPIDFHTHCTPGYGLGSALMAIIKGVDILDTNIWWFGGGSAAPALELIYVFCKKLDIKVEVNMEAVAEIRYRLKDIRSSLSDFDLNKDNFPRDFDPLKDTLPTEIDRAFDEAIAAAQSDDEASLLVATRKIEDYFGFPKANLIVKNAEVPGGMYSNMVAQLKALQASDLLEDAMALIPKVRRDAGLVPLVTPTSQIVGSQAVLLAMDRKAGRADYTTKNNQFISLIRGEYGKTPVEISADFRLQITGDATEHDYDTSKYKKPENPQLPEFDNVKLAQNDQEYLLYELLPSVAEKYLKGLRAKEYPPKQTEPTPTTQEQAVETAPITGPVLKALMCGQIVDVQVKEGDKVKKGQTLVTYEAMKMQNDIESEFDGTVKRVLVTPGENVLADQPLVEFE